MARKKTASRGEAFSFADVEVARGTKCPVEIPVARLPPGDWSSMPVVVAHGATDGPVVWLSGAIHGDELNGVEIVRRLLSRIAPESLSGTVIAVPIVNVFGVTAGSRYLPDRRDLNRSFPGSRRGSLGSRLAKLFFENVATRCEVGLDFHTGSGGRSNLPQVRCDLDDAETRRLAEAFAPEILLHATLRDGSLRAAARKHGVRVLLYEGGEAHRFDETAIEQGVSGALRVLKTMGMVEEAPAPRQPATPVSRSSSWVRAGRSGFCQRRVALGDAVDSGQCLATITNAVGAKGLDVRARFPGVVIGVLHTALVHRGDAVVHVARLEES